MGKLRPASRATSNIGCGSALFFCEGARTIYQQLESAALLRAVPDIRPIYLLPDEPFVKEILIPCFAASSAVDTMVGFFSSHVLSSIAPGLATFINKTNGTFRLIISPYLSPDDRAALEEANAVDTIVNRYLEDVFLTEDDLEKHTLRCLTWLIKTGRIELKIALMREAMMHLKVWLFSDEIGDFVSAHGSSNATLSGLQRNIEQVAVSTSWGSPDQLYTTEKLRREFTQLWSNLTANCIVVSLPDAVREKLLRTFNSDAPPQEKELEKLYEKIAKQERGTLQIDLQSKEQFLIPPYLEYETGPYAHQGEAVTAWCNAGYRGILEMATGSGKTIAAMICAYRLNEQQRPLLVVVSAPYIPLIEQWCDEIQEFGLTPINLNRSRGERGRAQDLGRVRRRLQNQQAGVVIVVTSHAALAMQSFQDELQRFRGPKLLIADEAHNLGSEGFIENAPDCFDHRLGLSATPVRQYDADGTQALFDYLGPVVYQYTLEEAIGNCLVEYDYHVHPVELTPSEMSRWYDLTTKIKQNAWREDETGPDDFLTKLLRDRRAVLENAVNKVEALADCLNQENLRELRHTLVYTSDKDREQITSVNRILKESGLLFSQFTYEETAHRDQAMRTLGLFKDGTIQVLSAKRVLDEGVNVPEIKKAYILASTTVERQWIQRRGRLLRKCDAVGKTHSVIHDFITLPPCVDGIDNDSKSIVGSELIRVRQFARLARNAGRSDGPLPIIERLVSAAYI